MWLHLDEMNVVKELPRAGEQRKKYFFMGTISIWTLEKFLVMVT